MYWQFPLVFVNFVLARGVSKCEYLYLKMLESGKEGKREVEEKDAKRGREEERIRKLRLLFFLFIFVLPREEVNVTSFCFVGMLESGKERKREMDERKAKRGVRKEGEIKE